MHILLEVSIVLFFVLAINITIKKYEWWVTATIIFSFVFLIFFAGQLKIVFIFYEPLFQLFDYLHKIPRAILTTLCCYFPTLIGILNLKKIDKNYLPLLYLLVFVCFVETLVCATLYTNISAITKVIAYNFYKIFAIIFYLFFYFNLNIIKSRKALFIILLSSLILSLFEILYLIFKQEQLNIEYVYYINLIIIVFLATEYITTAAVQNQNSLFIDFGFVVSCGILIVSIFYLFSKIVLKFGVVNMNIKGSIWKIYQYINGFIYFIYTYALLCLTKQKTFLK